jgi:glycosyltransferase 2 family protein
MQMNNSPSSSRKPASLLRVVGTVISLILLVYLLSEQGWSEIVAAIRQISFWRMALALALMLVSRLAVTARWHVLLRSGHIPIDFRQTLRITFAGLFASNFLPTTVGGDLVRWAGILQLKYDAAVSTASLIVDRLVGMAGMALAIPLCIPALLGGQVSSSLLLPYLRRDAGQSAALALAVAAPSGKPGWLRRGWEKGAKALRHVYQALKLWLKQPGALGTALAFSGLHMLCLFSVIYILLEGMGVNMPIWLIAGLYSLVYFVTLVPISINGYGVQEISMTLIFSNLGRASLQTGLTAALLFRTLMMIASLPGAFFIPDILASRNKATEDVQTLEGFDR